MIGIREGQDACHRTLAGVAMTLRVFIGTLIAAIFVAAAGVADAQPLPSAKPEEVGLSSAGLVQLSDFLKSEIEKGRTPGAVIAIARRGKLAYFEAFGFRDKAAEAPMPKDAIFSIASMTKQFVAVAIMMLVEERRLGLDDVVGKHLPPLANFAVGVIKADLDGKSAMVTVPAAHPVTIRELLRNTSGLTYGAFGQSEIYKRYQPGSVAAAFNQTSTEFLEQIGKAPLLHEPGTVWEYGFSTDVLGLVVEAVSGKSLGMFLDERLFSPLGMTDTGFVVPAEKKARYALPLSADPGTGTPQSVPHTGAKPLKFECGGACAVSTAGDYLRFTQMLLNGGMFDGKRLLSEASVHAMTVDQLGQEIKAKTPATVLPTDFGWGFGFAVRLRDEGDDYAGSKGDFSWAGNFGTEFWGDPQKELAVVYMAHTPGPTRFAYWKKIRSLVKQALVD